MSLAHLLGGLDPLALEGGWHPDIGHDDLGRRLFGAGYQAVVIAGHAHHLHVRGAADQRPNPLANDQIVIRQKDGDLMRRHEAYLTVQQSIGQGREPPGSRACWPPRGSAGSTIDATRPRPYRGGWRIYARAGRGNWRAHRTNR